MHKRAQEAVGLGFDFWRGSGGGHGGRVVLSRKELNVGPAAMFFKPRGCHRPTSLALVLKPGNYLALAIQYLFRHQRLAFTRPNSARAISPYENLRSDLLASPPLLRCRRRSDFHHDPRRASSLDRHDRGPRVQRPPRRIRRKCPHHGGRFQPASAHGQHRPIPPHQHRGRHRHTEDFLHGPRLQLGDRRRRSRPERATRYHARRRRIRNRQSPRCRRNGKTRRLHGLFIEGDGRRRPRDQRAAVREKYDERRLHRRVRHHRRRERGRVHEVPPRHHFGLHRR